VVDSYPTGFIGEVRISNASGGPRPWTVRLVFGSNVGVMRTFWVESQPQATLRRSGPAYVFTSSVPVAARSSVLLRFQFDRSGSDSPPVSCSTNGLTCTGL
jgi:Cellulose binding domain